MTEIFENPHRGRALAGLDLMPADDAGPVAALLAMCPAHAPTPLITIDGIGVLKDERSRMGLGSFKALGAAYAIAREAADVRDGDWASALVGRVFVTASAGNHGLSVAAGARLFGARAVIYLSETVPEDFAERLRGKGADVRRAGAHYEASMVAAENAARDEGFTLLSDSSWPGYTHLPGLVMEGYLQMAAEVADAMPEAPDVMYLQAGVGGMAAAMAGYARRVWGDGPRIVVVEPEAAPALIEAAKAGAVVDTEGPVSAMGRLDCKTASLIAAGGLLRDADAFLTISEAEGQAAVDHLAGLGIATTASGAAGVAGRMLEGFTGRSVCFISEGPSDG